jgi:hypothetical protein
MVVIAKKNRWEKLNIYHRQYKYWYNYKSLEHKIRYINQGYIYHGNINSAAVK